MLFGPRLPNFKFESYIAAMKNKSLIAAGLVLMMIYSCSCNKTNKEMSISPEAGAQYKAGDQVSVKINYADTKPDSVVYLLDSVKFLSKKDTAAITLKTDTMHMGARLITAKVFSGGKGQELSTNIIVLAAKAPDAYKFTIEKVYPHDTSSFTEGLVYQDGILYESAGGYLDPPPGQVKDQQSSLRTESLETGKVLQKTMVDPKVFGEGISVVGDKIIQLTWTTKIAYIYDKKSLKLLKTLPNNVGVEGWGMCFDGFRLYMDDSTNRIWFLNKDTYQQTGYIDVYDDKGPINQLNELEMIDGKIYANIWETDNIVIINPKTGVVEGKIDLTNLYPKAKRAPTADVLNGIAYDAQGKRLFLTGKKWPHLYQVKVSK